MQHEITSPSNGDSLGSSISSAPFVSLDQIPLSPSYVNNGDDLASLYAMFTPQEEAVSQLSPLLSAAGSLSISPSSVSFDDAEAAAAEERLYLAHLSLQYQDLAERYDACLSQLHDAAEEVTSLRRENAILSTANGELVRRLALFAGKQAGRISPSADAAFADELRRLSIVEPPPTDESPTSVLAFQESGSGSHHRFSRQAAAEKRAPLPKSISIRSSGYLNLKVNQAGGANIVRSGRSRVSNPSGAGSQQRVFVGAGSSNKKEKAEEEKEFGEGGGGGGALELEVYHQGMFKTELCNKWEESGECPYGDHCQFAHGIAELRPVLRHPRYKTELCRMVLFGDSCPYGHRCHFRHSLSPSEQQRLLRP